MTAAAKPDPPAADGDADAAALARHAAALADGVEAALPGWVVRSVVARAEAWRALIRAHPVGTGQGAAEITFSAGISAYPDTASSFAQMLQQADKAVYAAKRAGRNRVVVARQPAEYGDSRMRSA